MTSKILNDSQAIWGLGLLAFAGLCSVCIYWHTPQLVGADAAASRPATTPLIAPRLEARLLDGKVTLNGLLPDQAAKAQVLARAEELYGEGKFVDNLQISNQTAFPTQGWFQSALALLPVAARANNEGGFSMEGNIVIVRGLVDSEEAKAKLVTEAANAVGSGIRVEDKINVKGKISAAQAADFQAQLNQRIAGKIVEFDTGSDRLTERGKAVLDEMVNVLANAPGLPVEIGGHTDARGPAIFNQTLSQRRARACLRYLAQKGVAAHRLSSKGYGSTKPLADKEPSNNKLSKF
jgi:OOP family OmpA-OmpF porin